MQRRNKLIPYSLKLDSELWSEIDRNRMSMVGVLHPQGITKVDYIRNALTAYNEYFEKSILPRVNAVKGGIRVPAATMIAGLD